MLLRSLLSIIFLQSLWSTIRPVAEPNIVWGGDTPTLPLTNLFCDLDFAPVNYDDDDVDDGTANIIHYLPKRSNFSSLYMLHDDGDDDVDNIKSDDNSDDDDDDGAPSIIHHLSKRSKFANPAY